MAGQLVLIQSIMVRVHEGEPLQTYGGNMKYVYKIYYEQKFGKLWRDYTANVIGGEDACWR